MNFNFIYDELDKLKTNTINYAPKLLLSIIILLIFFITAKYFKKYMNNKYKIDDKHQSINMLRYEISLIIYYLIFIMGIIFTLISLGFNIATIITILGTIGFSLGLAFQETFKNIIASILICMYNLYSIGDIISIKSLGSQIPLVGKVTNIDLYTTQIMDTTTKLITTIPNITINNNIVSNISRSST